MNFTIKINSILPQLNKIGSKYTTILFITFLMIFNMNLYAQKKNIKGSGNISTETRSVSNFDKISISGSFDVILIKGDEGTIKIDASDNIIESIITEVKDDVLKVRFKKGINIRTSKSIDVSISYEDIEGVALSGSGSVGSTSKVHSESLALKVSGSGNMKLDVDSKQLLTAISGSGNLKLTGDTEDLSCSVSGSGNLSASDLSAKIVNAKISGSGNIKIHAINEIHAKTSGSGNIIYSGNPGIIKSNSSGSGSVKQKNN